MNFLFNSTGRAVPAASSLLMWEWVSAYEKCPTEAELLGALESDFPESCRRLKEAGGRLSLWPLISFNSAEGRRFRYLVAMTKNLGAGDGARNGARRRLAKRFLPVQIWLYGQADDCLRKSEGVNGSCDGNVLFYSERKGVLTVLIFCEGRLCHWIEESGYGDASKINDRLRDLQEFLKRDSFFGRHESFECVGLEIPDSALRKKFFLAASADPFWRGLDLRDAGGCSRDSGLSYTLLCIFLAAIFLTGYFGYVQKCDVAVSPIDVPPPELSLFVEDSAFERSEVVENFADAGVLDSAKSTVRGLDKSAVQQAFCDTSILKVQGLISDKLFVSNGAFFRVGDSLGGFRVESIGRQGVEFGCGGQNYSVMVKGAVGE